MAFLMGYVHITNQQRLKLVRLSKTMPLKHAALQCGMSYSSARVTMAGLKTQSELSALARPLIRPGTGRRPKAVDDQDDDDGDELTTVDQDQRRLRAAAAGVNDPIPFEKLCDEAKRALEDIAYFAVRYFGYVLMPWHVEATAKIVALYDSPRKEYVVINLPPGVGKAQALDTPVPTPTGWSTIGELRIGDELFDEHGNVCRVTDKSQVWQDRPRYEVTTDSGGTVVADAEHEWPVRMWGAGTWGYVPVPDRAGKTGPKASKDGIALKTSEFLSRPRAKRTRLRVAGALYLPDAALPIDPYVLGVWLGDGDSDSATITSAPEDAKYVRHEFELAGYVTGDKNQPQRFSVSGGGGKWSRDSFVGELRALGVLGNKHVPAAYLRGSIYQRLSLLQGLIDTDGYVAPNGTVEFCNTNRGLAYAVLELARSLGVKASIAESRAMLEGRDCGPKWRVTFLMNGAARLPRKAILCRDGVRTPDHYLSATQVGNGPTQCIEVDSPSHLYLSGEAMLPSHNSTFFTLVLPTWLTCRDRNVRGLIGSTANTTAKWYTGRLRDTFTAVEVLETSDADRATGLASNARATLLHDFGMFRPDAETDGIWTQTAFDVRTPSGARRGEKEHTWQSFGRGQKFIGVRVDFAIWDDVYDEQDMKTPEARQHLKEWWDKYAETRLEPRGLLILQGQRLGADDIYRHALDKADGGVDDIYDDGLEDEGRVIADDGKMYHHIVFRAHYEELCKGDCTPCKAKTCSHKAADVHGTVTGKHCNGDGSHCRYAPAYPNGCLLYPGRLPWSECARLMRNDKRTWEVVYQQNDDGGEGTKLVDDVWIEGGTDKTGTMFPGCLDHDRVLGEWPQHLKGPFKRYVTVDPSPEMFWAVEDWLYDADTQNRYLLNMHRDKMRSPDLLHTGADGKLAGIMALWQARSMLDPVSIGTWIVEQNTGNRFLLQITEMSRFQQMFGVDLVRHDTYRNKTDPKHGVSSIATQYRHGRKRLPYAGLETRAVIVKLIDELTHWPDYRTDDTVMADWFGEFALPNLPFDSNGLGASSAPTYDTVPSWLTGRPA